MTAPAEEEMTELYDADLRRVDLVKEGANGVPRFLIAKQAGDGQGLVPPEMVRELIGKQAAPEPAPERDDGQVTVKGSPAAIAKLIHAASQRADSRDEDAELAVSKAVYEAVVKEKYSTGDRKHMAGNEAMEDGSYPVKDEEDLKNAIRAVGRGGSSHNAIRRHVVSRAKSLGKSSMIPDNWASDGSLKEKVGKDMADTMGPDLDEGVDGLDPTVPLAAPDDDKPGDPTDPGSPAWEAIDAATAQKWTSIAVRLKNALCIMSEREWLEAAAGDEDDAGKAMDLEDAKCAVDYVIDVLAGFAVTEQAEADLGGEAMEAVGKTAAPAPEVQEAIRKALDVGELPRALTTIETFNAVVAKAGRVLSSVNETHIREAAGRLNTVLAALP
ncbi:MAG: hypothetical protein KGJ86_09210, partial [Chloroflexota bacterium]|nr:hypothetical protein [Chloroflexota bacterium]